MVKFHWSEDGLLLNVSEKRELANKGPRVSCSLCRWDTIEFVESTKEMNETGMSASSSSVGSALHSSSFSKPFLILSFHYQD